MTELWLVDLQRSAAALAAVEAATPRLTAQDRRRAQALADPRARAERLTLAIALRLLIARVAGPEPARRTFGTGPGGKPRLMGPLDFSVSHVHGYGLIGVTIGGSIGVDLERERPLRLSVRRRQELIAAAEGLAGAPLADASPADRFLQAWCRIEAFAKARGSGLGRTLADLGLRSGRPRTPADVAAAARSQAREARLAVGDLTIPKWRHAPCLYAAVARSGSARTQPAWLPADRPGLERLLVRSAG